MQVSEDQAKILAHIIKDDIKAYIKSHSKEYAKFLIKTRNEVKNGQRQS